VARRRKFSDDPFGPTIERLMGETGVTYRGLADKTRLSAGYLNHLVHGNRPVPSDKVVARSIAPISFPSCIFTTLPFFIMTPSFSAATTVEARNDTDKKSPTTTSATFL
jgi:hypothetical protein